ncbi:M48 family metallopeptidase [Patescibacteria group bacterium]|nr:M48 family metallopeptidase [Patescibacteria group bacterium]
MPVWPQFFTVRRRRRVRTRKRAPAASYVAHKESARALISERTRHHAELHTFTFGRIAIRDTRRSWGSCSSKGNLNFNYKLLFLPPCLREYIIIHELCHLRVLNHSVDFWREVESLMPDAKARAVALRQFERTSGTSVSALTKLTEAHAECSQCLLIE